MNTQMFELVAKQHNLKPGSASENARASTRPVLTGNGNRSPVNSGSGNRALVGACWVA